MAWVERIKNIFSNKEKRVENLVSFLIILIITLIFINKILKEDDTTKKTDYVNETGVELASSDNVKTSSDELEKKLENILKKVSGVGNVSVLLTYSESDSIIPVYNVSQSTSTTEEKDTSGGTRTIVSEDNKKDVITDSSSNIVTEKKVMPKIEGAIVTAEGAKEPNIKSNIISAVEAVTGLANHKIQVFEMGE
jgi:stage III sporulation protein AG